MKAIIAIALAIVFGAIAAAFVRGALGRGVAIAIGIALTLIILAASVSQEARDLLGWDQMAALVPPVLALFIAMGWWIGLGLRKAIVGVVRRMGG